jgi:molybdopterin synthase sulfur carrier subunit
LQAFIKQEYEKMSVQIDIPPLLRHLSDGATAAKVMGSTVGDCLNHFIEQYPRTKKLLLDKDGKLLRYVEVYVNKVTTYPEELATPVNDGDEISIVYVISGG